MAGSRKQQAPLGCSVKCKGFQAPLHGSWWGSPLKPRNVVITGTQGGDFSHSCIHAWQGGETSFVYCKTPLEVFAKAQVAPSHPGTAPTPPHPAGRSSAVPSSNSAGEASEELLPTAVQCQQQNAALLLISGSIVPKCSRHQDTAEGSPCPVLPAGTRNPPPSPTAL